jgi:hypothetical protein
MAFAPTNGGSKANKRESCYRLALASRTAAKKQKILRGMLRARIVPVIGVPYCGVPEDNSKIEPTAAIAATQEQASKKPLFGVVIMI